MKIIIYFQSKIERILKNRFKYTRRVSRTIAFSLIVLLIISIAGCEIPTPIPDPYRQDVERWTSGMTDEVAAAFAQIFHAGIVAVSDSRLIATCGGDKTASLQSYGTVQGMSWSNISTTVALREILLDEKFRDYLGLLDSIMITCGGPVGAGQDPYMARIYALMMEQMYIQENTFDEITNTSPDINAQYLECLNEINKYLQDNACNPLADDGANIRRTAVFPDHTVVAQKPPPSSGSDGGNTAPDDPGASKGSSPGNKSTSHYTLTDNTGAAVEVTLEITELEESVSLKSEVIPGPGTGEGAGEPRRKEVNLLSWRWFAKWGIGFLIGLGLKAILVPAIIAGGPLGLMILTLGVAIFQEIAFENSIPKSCPPLSGVGVMDARLPVGHELKGKNYQIDGISLGPKEHFDSCNCLFDPTNPLTSWGCKSEAEQRRDCALNPYGPDDAPRPECTDLLYEDTQTTPSPICPINCPEPYDLKSDCTCGNPGGVFSLDVPLACSQIRCEDGGEPSIDPQTGICGCLSVEGNQFNECLSPPLCDDQGEPKCIFPPCEP